MNQEEEFDISESTEIFIEWEGDPMFEGYEHTLYKGEDGRHFIWTMSGEDAKERGRSWGKWITDEEALEWLKEYEAPEEVINEHFKG